jgi:hypothetical protein
MLLLKLLTILLLTLILWVILRVFLGAFKIARLIRTGFSSAQATQFRSAAQSNAAGGQNTMVKCAHCELYVLENEAIRQAGYFYCSREHARQM